MFVFRSGGALAERLGSDKPPISVPFLSPLVLRKELETVITGEGDMCLTHARFVDEHPIIYWNMLYFFQRLQVDSHLPGFALTSETTNDRQQPVS